MYSLRDRKIDSDSYIWIWEKNYEFFNDVKSKPVLQKPLCGSSLEKGNQLSAYLCVYICFNIDHRLFQYRKNS